MNDIASGIATILGRVAPMLPAFHAVSRDPTGDVWRHVLRWSAPAVLLGVGALWLGYVYAPGLAADGPVYAMWSSVPDLAISTIAGTVLTLISVVVLGVGVLRRAPRAGRPVPQG